MSSRFKPKTENGVERYVTPCALPEGLDRELLTIMQEECAEVIQDISKALRFGVDHVHGDSPLTAMQKASLEIGDLAHMMLMLEAQGLSDPEYVAEGLRRKPVKLRRYIQHDK